MHSDDVSRITFSCDIGHRIDVAHPCLDDWYRQNPDRNSSRPDLRVGCSRVTTCELSHNPPTSKQCRLKRMVPLACTQNSPMTSRVKAHRLARYRHRLLRLPLSARTATSKARIAAAVAPGLRLQFGIVVVNAESAAYCPLLPLVDVIVRRERFHRESPGTISAS